MATHIVAHMVMKKRRTRMALGPLEYLVVVPLAGEFLSLFTPEDIE